MQGYQKNEIERNFELQVEEFVRSLGVAVFKNYAPKIDEFSRPDFFLCLHGRFVALEIENYTQFPEDNKPIVPKMITNAILHSKGGYLTVSPATFENFKKAFLSYIKIFRYSKSFDEKIKENQMPKPNPKPQKPFSVEVKKKKFFNKNGNFQNRNNQKSRY